MEAEDSEVTARTMKSAGDAKKISSGYVAVEFLGGCHTNILGASAPLTATGWGPSLHIEVAKLAPFHDAFFERLLEYVRPSSATATSSWQH